MKAGHKPGSVNYSERNVGDHLSGTAVTSSLKRFIYGTRQDGQPRFLTLLLAGVYLASTSRNCWCALTAPLHPCLCFWESPKVIGGVFLWHYPHGHPHWELPSKPDHHGARTFLNRFHKCHQHLSIDCDHLPCFQIHNASKA